MKLPKEDTGVRKVRKRCNLFIVWSIVSIANIFLGMILLINCQEMALV